MTNHVFTALFAASFLIACSGGTTPVDSAGPDASANDASDSDAAAAGDALPDGAQIYDEACPPGSPNSIRTNCSNTCGAPNMQCSWGCDGDIQVVKVQQGDLPYYIRTPHDFSGQAPCSLSCPGTFPYGIEVDVSAIPDLQSVRLVVPAPFVVANPDGILTPRCNASSPTTCHDFTTGGAHVFVYLPAGESNPGSRNIVIERAPAGHIPCP